MKTPNLVIVIVYKDFTRDCISLNFKKKFFFPAIRFNEMGAFWLDEHLELFVPFASWRVKEKKIVWLKTFVAVKRIDM